MSQAKVDRNKEQKANRKQIIAREKRQLALVKLCGVAILVAILSWAGISAYNIYESSQPAIYTDLTAIDDFAASLSDAE